MQQDAFLQTTCRRDAQYPTGPSNRYLRDVFSAILTIGRVREKEVDFVCEKDGGRLYVQVANLMPTEETSNRVFRALNSVLDQFRKMVLSMDKADFSAGGIIHRYLPDFLAHLSGTD